MIINHNHPLYHARWLGSGINKYNGAYYYSIEICKNIIPNVNTDRNWITINIPIQNNVPQFGARCGCNHSIVFIHNNLHPEYYDWLKKYDDLVLVCGIPDTCDKVAHLGTPIYLPLSVDVAEIKRFKKEKTKESAYVGRKAKRIDKIFSEPVDFIEGLPRDQLLSAMAEYKKVYAVGRTAIEARVLGCEIGVYDSRFPDSSIWKVIDNSDAVDILQKRIDEIDGKAE